jgi:hypothetical protein
MTSKHSKTITTQGHRDGGGAWLPGLALGLLVAVPVAAAVRKQYPAIIRYLKIERM